MVTTDGDCSHCQSIVSVKYLKGICSSGEILDCDGHSQKSSVIAKEFNKNQSDYVVNNIN